MSEEILFLTFMAATFLLLSAGIRSATFSLSRANIGFVGSWSAELIFALQICFPHCFYVVKYCGFSGCYCVFYNM